LELREAQGIPHDLEGRKEEEARLLLLLEKRKNLPIQFLT